MFLMKPLGFTVCFFDNLRKLLSDSYEIEVVCKDKP